MESPAVEVITSLVKFISPNCPASKRLVTYIWLVRRVYFGVNPNIRKKFIIHNFFKKGGLLPRLHLDIRSLRCSRWGEGYPNYDGKIKRHPEKNPSPLHKPFLPWRQNISPTWLANHCGMDFTKNSTLSKESVDSTMPRRCFPLKPLIMQLKWEKGLSRNIFIRCICTYLY